MEVREFDRKWVGTRNNVRMKIRRGIDRKNVYNQTELHPRLYYVFIILTGQVRMWREVTKRQ